MNIKTFWLSIALPPINCYNHNDLKKYLRGRAKFPTGGKVREPAKGVEPVRFRYRQYSLDGRRKFFCCVQKEFAMPPNAFRGFFKFKAAGLILQQICIKYVSGRQ